MYNYTYLCAYQILMIAILTKWLPFYKKNDIGEALGKACEQDCDTAAQTVRRYMFEYTDRFSGPFQGGCREDSVPNVLVAMVNMVLDGPSINNQSLSSSTQAALSIAQLLKFNSVKQRRKQGATNTQEPPAADTVRLKKLLFQPIGTLFTLAKQIQWKWPDT